MATTAITSLPRSVRGELPAQKVYEDADTLAFMDIMPRCQGHMLVMPKTPARNVLDASQTSARAPACAPCRRCRRRAMKAFGAAGITIQQFNEQAGGRGGVPSALPRPAAF